MIDKKSIEELFKRKGLRFGEYSDDYPFNIEYDENLCTEWNDDDIDKEWYDDDE